MPGDLTLSDQITFGSSGVQDIAVDRARRGDEDWGCLVVIWPSAGIAVPILHWKKRQETDWRWQPVAREVDSTYSSWALAEGVVLTLW